jgi:gag-polyprotein putative aspartyl protease
MSCRTRRTCRQLRSTIPPTRGHQFDPVRQNGTQATFGPTISKPSSRRGSRMFGGSNGVLGGPQEGSGRKHHPQHAPTNSNTKVCVGPSLILLLIGCLIRGSIVEIALQAIVGMVLLRLGYSYLACARPLHGLTEQEHFGDQQLVEIIHRAASYVERIAATYLRESSALRVSNQAVSSAASASLFTSSVLPSLLSEDVPEHYLSSRYRYLSSSSAYAVRSSPESQKTTKETSPSQYQFQLASQFVTSKMSTNRQPRGEVNSSPSSASSAPVPIPTPASIGGDEITPTPLRVQLLPPGSPGAPYFDGHHVTEFLQNFVNMCDDSGITLSNRVARLGNYCVSSIKSYIHTLPEYHARAWGDLAQVLTKEFKKYDEYQLMRSIGYLEWLKKQQMTDVRQYCRLYKTSADYLMSQGLIGEYQCSLWFLQGLPEKLAGRFVKDDNIDVQDPSSMKFGSLYKKALRQCEFEDQVAALHNVDWSGDAVLLKASTGRPVVPDVPTVVAPVVSAMAAVPVVSRDGVATTVDDLASSFAKMMINHLGVSAVQGQSGIGMGRVQREGLDPARQSNQPAQPYAYPSSALSRVMPTCYFCGVTGHLSTKCLKKQEMMDRGQIHLSEMGRVILGPRGSGGVEVPWSRDKAHIEIIQGYLTESMMNPKSEKPMVRSVKLVRVEESDTEEEEGSDFEGLGVRAARTAKPREAAAPTGKGPVLDATRRVMKDRQTRESILPSTKSMRSGRYGKSAHVQDVDNSEQEIAASQPSTQDTVREEERPIRILGTLDDDVEMQDQVARPKPKRAMHFATDGQGSTGQKLTRTLTQMKNAGAHQLANALLKQEVSVTVENLLAGSSDVRKLLFTAKEWDNQDDAIVSRRNPPLVVETPATAAKAKSVRFVEDDIVQDPAEMALCPEFMVSIRGRDVKALIDTGAECNLMSAQLAQTLRLPVTKLPDCKFQAVSYSGLAQKFVGMARNVIIDVHGVQVRAHFFVAERMDQANCILLGSPYHQSAQLGLWRMPNGAMICSLRDPVTEEVVEFEIEEPEIEREIYPSRLHKQAPPNSNELKESAE